MKSSERTPGVAFYGKVRIPTIGHAKAIDTARGIADKVGGKLHIGLSGTSHPLTPKTKKEHAEKVFNHPVETGEAHTSNLFSYLGHLNKSHDDIHLVAGSDRAPEYRRTLEQWNGKADKTGKVPFHFKSWKVHEVEGKREDSDKHPTKMSQDELEKSVSATKLEKLGRSGDYEGFKAYHPGLPEKHVRKVFNQIKGAPLEAPKPVSLKSIKAKAPAKKLKEEHMTEIGELNHEKFGPMLDTFVQFASKKLGIKSLPTHELKKDEMATSFAAYNPSEKHMIVVTKNRHPMDIYRSVAHELVHHKQNEDGRLGKDISKEGATGSDIENEANSEAGKVMRWYAKENPSTFKSGYVIESYLDEGINDPAKMKAVFLAGGSGSGKDYIMNRTLEGHGMTEINSDNALEHLMKKRGLDLKMPPSEDFERNLVRGKAKNLTKEKERLAIAGRKGLIINGTADDPDKIATIKAELERNGYQTKMLFVHTSNEVSRQRNLERGLQGGRKVPDGTNNDGVPDGSRDIRTEKWEAAQEAKQKLKGLFGDEHYNEIDNSEDLRKVSPERKKQIEAEHNQLFKHYKKFASAPVESPAAKEYETTEKKKRSISDIRKTKATTMSQRPNKPKPDVKQPPYVPNASEIEQAKRLGVEHIGDGQFGKKAKGQNVVSHASKKGQLTAVRDRLAEEKKMQGKDPCWTGYEMIGKKKKNGKEVPNCVPVDEAFEAFMEENTPSDREWGKDSLTKIYKEMTPGQTAPENPLFEKKKMLKKKLTKEDNMPPLGYELGNSGIGQEFGIVRSPNGLGTGYSMPMTSMAESIQSWASSEKTQNRFIEKYGDLADQKLYEAATRLNTVFEDVDHSPKFFSQLRESFDKGVGQMGTLNMTNNKDEPIDEETPAWQRKEGKNPEGGLNQKGVASYRAANPGSKLKTAVTTKPSKLKPGSKAANRRKSFCARMGGMKKRLTSAKTANDPDSRINKSLRKWNCEE